jgi:hypothetical protein
MAAAGELRELSDFGDVMLELRHLLQGAGHWPIRALMIFGSGAVRYSAATAAFSLTSKLSISFSWSCKLLLNKYIE